MGAEGFHGRVRDGIGCLAPRYGYQAREGCARGVSGQQQPARPRPGVWRCARAVVRRWLWPAPVDQADRAISTGQLRGLRPFHLRPIDVVVYHGSWRDLVLRRVSRLDAFSGYPVRT